MRGLDRTQTSLFSYRTLQERIPKTHPMRKLRVVVDGILASMDAEFDALYATGGRPSIPPERLLRASLLQTLYSIRSEALLVEHIEFNLLWRWFVGLDIDDAVWDASTFSANRDRLFTEDIARAFFRRVMGLAEWQGFVSDSHFTVDGTLIEAWASLKSFKAKDGSGEPPEDGGRNPTVNFKGERRGNDTHESTTDPEARLYKKAEGDKARLAYLGHNLMENRNGLVVDVELTQASGTAEREAAVKMAARSLKRGNTLGADKNYDTRGCVGELRRLGVTPHVAQKEHSAIDRRTTRHAGYAVSLIKRKLIEEGFGWGKTVGPLAKTHFVGLAKVTAQYVMTFAAYNLVRLASLMGFRLRIT